MTVPRRFATATAVTATCIAIATVIGSALAVTALFVVLLVPLVGGVRDFLKNLPATVEDLRNTKELMGRHVAPAVGGGGRESWR